jgi:hypothetical protein
LMKAVLRLWHILHDVYLYHRPMQPNILHGTREMLGDHQQFYLCVWTWVWGTLLPNRWGGIWKLLFTPCVTPLL